MEVFGDGDAARLVFSAYRSGVPELAAIVEEANLRQALERTLAGQPGLTRFDGATCASASWGDASLMLGLSDGRTLEASLVVAADGADSKLRALAGIDVQVKDYGQRGVVANFQAGVAHGNVARQWFRPDGVLALLPLPEGQVSMVWSTGEAHALALSQMDPDALGREVSAAAGGAPGSLRLAGPVHSFPLRRMHAARLIAPRLALLGDAAHSVHPLAGQGLNLGFGDAESLASVLARRGPESDCGARLLLRRYERSRKEAILAMEWVTDGLQALFDSRIPGAAALRNAGLRLTDGIPPLKRFLVKRALG
jgi:ubiquinone biosynthesis UbiH/UbiF/VisC/COQ6 family hydroxylase